MDLTKHRAETHSEFDLKLDQNASNNKISELSLSACDHSVPSHLTEYEMGLKRDPLLV